MKIVCIDDDPVTLKTMNKIIESHGADGDEVMCAGNGEEGIDLVKTRVPQVVLTDLVMPGVSGIEVLQTVKETDPHIEVIVITGKGSIESAVEAMKLGARDYLTKPINSGVLIGKLHTIRELQHRCAEAEEYRFAKEKIEHNAHRAVSQMEEKLSDCCHVCDTIEEMCERDIPLQERMEHIRRLVKNFRETHY